MTLKLCLTCNLQMYSVGVTLVQVHSCTRHYTNFEVF
jgi:hypothetical protein